MKQKYLYIIQNPAFMNWVKIGITDNIEKRLSQLRTGVPYRFKKLAIFSGTDEDVRKAEGAIHNIIDLLKPEAREANDNDGGDEFFLIGEDNVDDFVTNIQRIVKLDNEKIEKDIEVEQNEETVRKFDQKEKEFDEYRNYLISRKLNKNSTVKNYVSYLKRALKNEQILSFADATNKIDGLIKKYGSKEFTKIDHGTTVASLKKLKEYLYS